MRRGKQEKDPSPLGEKEPADRSAEESFCPAPKKYRKGNKKKLRRLESNKGQQRGSPHQNSKKLRPLMEIAPTRKAPVFGRKTNQKTWRAQVSAREKSNREIGRRGTRPPTQNVYACLGEGAGVIRTKDLTENLMERMNQKNEGKSRLLLVNELMKLGGGGGRKALRGNTNIDKGLREGDIRHAVKNSRTAWPKIGLKRGIPLQERNACQRSPKSACICNHEEKDRSASVPVVEGHLRNYLSK